MSVMLALTVGGSCAPVITAIRDYQPDFVCFIVSSGSRGSWATVDGPGNPCGNPRIIKCPACGIPMYRHIHLRTKEVLVDECGHCGGFFLDSGELRTTRDSYMNDQEEEEYINTQLAEMPDYQEAKADIEKMKKRNEAVRKYTKYIRLSYYVTGR